MRKSLLKDFSIRQFGLFLLFVAAFGLVGELVSNGSLFSPTAVYAQEEGAEEADAVGEQLDAAGGDEADGSETPPAQDSYLVWYLTALGPLFAPIFAVISVTFVMLIVMNWMSISRNNIMPQDMVDKFRELLEEQDFQQAYEVAKESESPQGRILAAGLAKMSSGFAAAEKSMSDVAEEEIMRLEQKLGYIGTVASIAPMVGLLGTVWGMVASFNVIARSAAAPQASELAGGISTALITTQVGLLIAIPAIIIFEFFRNKLALLVLEMTVLTENLMNRFKDS